MFRALLALAASLCLAVGLLSLFAVCLVVATLCFFGALRFLPLAEGSAISFLAPMFAIVLSMPVLGERPTRARWWASIDL